MSHELTIRTDGTAEMAYVGEVPWHGLGQALQPGAPIEEWLTAAGMDWRILRSIVRYNTVRGEENNAEQFMEMADSRVLFRSDSKAPLGIVSDKYKVVQPAAVLEFFRDLVHAGGFELNTAGTLFGGRRFWALAQIGETAFVADPRDKVKGNLLLCTSADGTMATEARFVTTRVVCNNTLGFARSEGKAKTKVSHRTVFDADSVKDALGVARERFEGTMNLFRILSETAMDKPAMARATCELLSPGFQNKEREAQRKISESKPVERIFQLATGHDDSKGADFDGVPGTAWGWLNAVTQYVDHEARARNQDNRVNSAWFGKGDSLKSRALEMLTGGAETGAAVLENILTGAA